MTLVRLGGGLGRKGLWYHGYPWEATVVPSEVVRGRRRIPGLEETWLEFRRCRELLDDCVIGILK